MTRREHLLTILAEECAEVAQRASKALRFGLNEVQPGQKQTNAHRLHEEWLDLVAVMEMIGEDGFQLADGWLGSDRSNDLVYQKERHILTKKQQVEKFLLYSKEQGTLKEV